MDFQPFDGKSDDGAKMVVTHPGTGEPTDATISLAGMDSKAWRGASKELQTRMLMTKSARNAAASVLGDSDENVAELLAAVTMSWENIKLDGMILECSKPIAKNLYVRYPWLREQVNQFVGNRANFFRSVAGSAGSSGESRDAAETATEE